MAHWAMRVLKHPDDAEALDVAREVQDMDRTIVRYCKKVERKRRKLYQAERSRAELAVRTGWNWGRGRTGQTREEPRAAYWEWGI